MLLTPADGTGGRATLAKLGRRETKRRQRNDRLRSPGDSSAEPRTASRSPGQPLLPPRDFPSSVPLGSRVTTKPRPASLRQRRGSGAAPTRPGCCCCGWSPGVSRRPVWGTQRRGRDGAPLGQRSSGPRLWAAGGTASRRAPTGALGNRLLQRTRYELGQQRRTGCVRGQLLRSAEGQSPLAGGSAVASAAGAPCPPAESRSTSLYTISEQNNTTALGNHTEHNFCQSPRYRRHVSIGLGFFCKTVFWKNYFKPVTKTADMQSWFHWAQMKTKGRIHCEGQSTSRISHFTYLFSKTPN